MIDKITIEKMERIKKIFHILSYIQYPLLIWGLYFTIKPFFRGFEYLSTNQDYFFSSYNNALILFGVALSFSSLQDSNKTSLKLEKKIYSNPKKGRFAILLTMIMVLVFFSYGFIGYFGLFEKSNMINEFSYGSIILGIGLVGYLKLQIEIFDNHRKDKH